MPKVTKQNTITIEFVTDDIIAILLSQAKRIANTTAIPDVRASSDLYVTFTFHLGDSDAPKSNETLVREASGKSNETDPLSQHSDLQGEAPRPFEPNDERWCKDSNP